MDGQTWLFDRPRNNTDFDEFFGWDPNEQSWSILCVNEKECVHYFNDVLHDFQLA